MVEQSAANQQNDDCLTSLNWLVQPAPILPLNPPTPPSTPPAVPCQVPLHQVQFPVAPKQIDYRVEHIKPPFSYAQLISMAMQAHGGEKVVLTDIYQWIRQNFSYFRGTDNSWQVNPAIKSFLEKTQRAQHSFKHPFSGTGERLEDIGAQESVYSDTNSGFDDFNQKLFKKDVEHFSGYIPQNDLVTNSGVPISTPLPATTTSIPDLTLTGPQERVRVEYNWEGYEYHPSNVFGAQLPLTLSPGGGMVLSSGVPLPPESNLSPPNSDESEGHPNLDLRIPTPDWWTNQVTTASLLSPTGSGGIYGGHNPLARVFENLNGSGNSTCSESIFPAKNSDEHPWEDKNLSHSVGSEGGLFDLDYANSSAVNVDSDCNSGGRDTVPATPGSCDFVDVETTDCNP